jgi:hypothetical protein
MTFVGRMQNLNLADFAFDSGLLPLCADYSVRLAGDSVSFT